MVTKAPPKKRRRVYVCGICGVTLKDEKWVYSATSGERYCLPSVWEACSVRAERRRGIS